MLWNYMDIYVQYVYKVQRNVSFYKKLYQVIINKITYVRKIIMYVDLNLFSVHNIRDWIDVAKTRNI
jgi:hypothetical protein